MRPTILALALVGLLIVPFALAQSSLEAYCQSQFGNMDTCLREIAIKRDDPSYCRDIETVASRNSCYTHFAKAKDDASFCGLVRKDRASFEPVFKCYEPFITSMANLSVCDSFERDEETQDLCYEHIYDIEENATLCPKFHDPKKAIGCFAEAAEETYAASYCDAIREAVDVELCKEREVEECDTAAHLADTIAACKYEAALQQRRGRCNAYENELESEFDEGETGEFIFKRDTDGFDVQVKSVDPSTGIAVVELKTGARRQDFNVRVGNVMTHEHINMYVVNIWKEEAEEAGEGEQQPDIDKVELCFFREPRAEEDEEDEEDAEEPAAEEPEVTVDVAPPEKDEEEPWAVEEEIVEEEETAPQEGFFRRAIRWFWGLFGIGG